MVHGKYNSSEEVLSDIRRELSEIGSDKLSFLWEEIEGMTVRMHQKTGSKGLAKKFFIEAVELNKEILLIDGVLAIYEAFVIERENFMRPHRNRGKLKRVKWQSDKMDRLEQIYIETQIH